LKLTARKFFTFDIISEEPQKNIKTGPGSTVLELPYVSYQKELDPSRETVPLNKCSEIGTGRSSHWQPLLFHIFRSHSFRLFKVRLIKKDTHKGYSQVIVSSSVLKGTQA